MCTGIEQLSKWTADSKSQVSHSESLEINEEGRRGTSSRDNRLQMETIV